MLAIHLKENLLMLKESLIFVMNEASKTAINRFDELEIASELRTKFYEKKLEFPDKNSCLYLDTFLNRNIQPILIDFFYVIYDLVIENNAQKSFKSLRLFQLGLFNYSGFEDPNRFAKIFKDFQKQSFKEFVFDCAEYVVCNKSNKYFFKQNLDRFLSIVNDYAFSIISQLTLLCYSATVAPSNFHCWAYITGLLTDILEDKVTYTR